MTTVFLGPAVLENLGPLHKAFLFDDPLATLRAEIEAAISQCDLFCGTGLDDLHLSLCFIRRDTHGASASDAGDPDLKWGSIHAGRAYVARIQFDIGSLLGGRNRASRDDALGQVLAAIRPLAVNAATRAAVEAGVEQARIDAFLRPFPDVAAEALTPRTPSPGVGKAARQLLDVHVEHDGGSASDVLHRRARLRGLLEHSLCERQLGELDGGSSGEFHYEFGFVVADVEGATRQLRTTLEAAGVPADRISFHLLGEAE